MKPNQLVIIGGGSSIREGLDKGLWNKIQGLWTFGLNYNYLDFKSTANIYIDPEFYDAEMTDDTLENGIPRKKIFRSLPLILGQNYVTPEILPNTILLKAAKDYSRDLHDGVYNPNLCGLWALTLAIYLLDEGEIYLLGFDCGEARKPEDSKKTPSNPIEFAQMAIRDEKTRKWLTHYYQGLRRNHRGIGKVDWFNMKNSTTGKTMVEKYFGPYQNETKCKIYNVSMCSKINTFPQITYDEFFARLSKETYNQDEIREYIKQKLISVPR